MAATTLQSVPSARKTAPARPAISTHLQLISPTQARTILHEEPYPQQRPLRPYHVQFLRQLMEAGDFRAGTLISFAILGNTRYLINGQHTLAALGETTGGPLWLQVEDLKVATLEEVGILYESYDRNLARSWKDLYRADQRLQRYDLASKHLGQLGGVTAYLATGFSQQAGFAVHPWSSLLKNARVRFALMADWQNEMLNFVNGCHGPSSVRKLLTRAAVLSIALVTYRFQPEAAHLFWPKVAADSGLLAGDPAHTLLRFLRENTTRAVIPSVYLRAVAATWNAAFEGRAMDRITHRRPGQPLLLVGTPHDGHRHKAYLSAEGSVLQQPQAVEEARQEDDDE